MHSFYLVIFPFLFCIADLAASAPTIDSVLNRRHLQPIDPPFPYGKLADKILNVNYVSYMKREFDEHEFEPDRVVTYTDHSVISSPPAISPASIELLPATSRAVPKTSTYSLLKRVVTQDVWEAAPAFLRTLRWSIKPKSIS